MDKNKIYTLWFALPAVLVYGIFFLLPMLFSFFFSLTVWDFNSFTFCGLQNFKMFFQEHSMNISIRNTIIYAVGTCVLKVFLSFLLANFLVSPIKSTNFLRAAIFFPQLVSSIAIGLVFSALMHPVRGLFNQILVAIGLPAVDWLGNPKIALFSVMAVDVWKGVGFATVIFLSGILAIDKSYYEAARIDGASSGQQMRFLTIPLSRPSRNSIILLSFIGGMRSFDLIWAMTQGGPGFATDVIASVIYKQYAAGFYGLSTAGNVIMFIFIAVIVFPLQQFLTKKEEY